MYALFFAVVLVAMALLVFETWFNRKQSRLYSLPAPVEPPYTTTFGGMAAEITELGRVTPRDEDLTG